MTHPLVLGLFDDPTTAAAAARALRDMGLPRERVSIVAKSHEDEAWLATSSDASPGSEIEDSAGASRLGELAAHFLTAIAVPLPGVGPILADGPLAAAFGEAAGHAAGDIGRTLGSAGLDRAEAERWESRIKSGAILVGAHVNEGMADAVREKLVRSGASEVTAAIWKD